MKAKLEGNFLILNLVKMTDPLLDEFLGKISDDATLGEVKKFSFTSEDTKRAALVRFTDEKSTLAFTTEASKSELNMLDSEKIARMLLANLTDVNTTLGYDNTTTGMVRTFMQRHGEELITHLFTTKENFTTICDEMGIGSDSPTKAKNQADELKKVLSASTIKEQPKKNSQAPANDVYQVSFLPNTNKVMLTCGNQAKVFAP